MGTSWWERVVYQIVYACATAWIDALRDNRHVDVEEANAADHRRAARFRIAVSKRLQSGSSGAGPVDPSQAVKTGGVVDSGKSKG